MFRLCVALGFRSDFCGYRRFLPDRFGGSAEPLQDTFHPATQALRPELQILPSTSVMASILAQSVLRLSGGAFFRQAGPGRMCRRGAASDSFEVSMTAVVYWRTSHQCPDFPVPASASASSCAPEG
jgi:hypothetical protein